MSEGTRPIIPAERDTGEEQNIAMTTEQCTEMMQMMGGDMMGGGMMGMMGMMMLGMIVFWTLVVIGTVLLVRFVWNRTESRKDSGVAILQERFARGEIDHAEYQERMQVLQRRGS